MVVPREKFSSQASPELLAAVRERDQHNRRVRCVRVAT